MAPDASQEEPPSKALVVCPTHLNKWVLNTTSAALFFLFIQLLIAVVLFGITDMLHLFQDRLTFNLTTCKGLLPMVVLNVLGLSFSAYTLEYVDASFYQVARGLVLPFTVAASYVMLHTRPSLGILASCAFVTAGFFCGVLLDGTPLSLIGITFGVASSSITAIATVVIKRSLPLVDGSSILLAWYANLLSAPVLLPLALLAGEGPTVVALLSGSPAPDAPAGAPSQLLTFLWGSLITGAVGFLMSIAGPLSIKVTSPISHMISSAVRGVASSVLALWLFHDVISAGRVASISVVLGGSIYYTWVKNRETEAAKAGAAYEQVPMDDLENGKQDEEVESHDES
ncbi:hypothetical protein GGX14DRAFT_454796 [Mycena pura]|uniref:Sugar phosphate transporter domain-containing protein n=1 Tax=Mycena pura TaxID=153505 RepID=A0AAD6YDU8_9AGAR|nr:hypothetical protein GGX14DRAFT_454796 [Mycena pura]